jgi:hypothetical protein
MSHDYLSLHEEHSEVFAKIAWQTLAPKCECDLNMHIGQCSLSGKGSFLPDIVPNVFSAVVTTGHVLDTRKLFCLGELPAVTAVEALLHRSIARP